ncbi:hypothetical protein BSKO_13481 [Bryopsis sp. KO-2023]|nr:hypothetical protein BSKO_13481 [Bryopsis sp. KO-2023]
MSSAALISVPETVELVVVFEGEMVTVSLNVSGGCEEFSADGENVSPRIEDRASTSNSATTEPRSPERRPFHDITDPDRRRAFTNATRFFRAQDPTSSRSTEMKAACRESEFFVGRLLGLGGITRATQSNFGMSASIMLKSLEGD